MHQELSQFQNFFMGNQLKICSIYQDELKGSN